MVSLKIAKIGGEEYAAAEIKREEEALAIEMASSWLMRRRSYVLNGTGLSDVEMSAEHCAKMDYLVECLGALHEDAGLRGFRRGSYGMYVSYTPSSSSRKVTLEKFGRK